MFICVRPNGLAMTTGYFLCMPSGCFTFLVSPQAALTTTFLLLANVDGFELFPYPPAYHTQGLMICFRFFPFLVFTCAPPTVGEDVTYSPVKTTYEARETLTYSCVPGKALLGASAATCDSQDLWNPSTVPTCTGI